MFVCWREILWIVPCFYFILFSSTSISTRTTALAFLPRHYQKFFGLKSTIKAKSTTTIFTTEYTKRGVDITKFNDNENDDNNNNNSNDKIIKKMNDTKNEEEVISESTLPKKSKSAMKKEQKQQQRNEQNAEWIQAKELFQQSLLDSTFACNPIRGNLINASMLYPSSFPNPLTATPGLMPGSHKHLGGAYDPTDGCIYGVPANSKSVLCIYPNNNYNNNSGDGNYQYSLKTIPLPERIQERNMKWLRGIIAHGYLWAIPAWADSVLCVDIDAFWGRRELPEGQRQTTTTNTNTTEFVNLIPLPESHPKNMRWQWHGAGINHEKTAIYCIPSNAKHVLKVDIATKTTSFIDIDIDPKYTSNIDIDIDSKENEDENDNENEKQAEDFLLENITNKWYGGIVGDDNAIYGIPYRACGVLRIDSKTDTAKLIGPNYGIGKYFWHGGIKVNGKIYAHPSHADTVLVIDTRTTITFDNDDDRISELPIHHRTKLYPDEEEEEQQKQKQQNTAKTYKWLGGCVGADGNIYCPACDTSAILKINVTTDYCETFGFAGTDKNKWQGGILGRDNCIYCIPANGRHVCRIATDLSNNDNNENCVENPVQLIGNLPEHKDKWQGASQGKDGSLYFIPENGYRIMKVTPPKTPPKIVNGKLPENDVKIEYM